MIKITGGNRRGALVIYDDLGSLFNLFPHETVLFGEDMRTARGTLDVNGRQGIYVASQEGTRRHQERGENKERRRTWHVYVCTRQVIKDCSTFVSVQYQGKWGTQLCLFHFAESTFDKLFSSHPSWCMTCLVYCFPCIDLFIYLFIFVWDI